MKDNFYDHYKDSFEQLKAYLNKRDKLTVWLYLCIIAVCFQLSQPDLFETAVNACLSDYIKGFQLETHVLGSGLLLFWLWITMQYYSSSMTIEWMYKYVHSLEENLTRLCKAYPIEREGRSYKENYSWFKKAMGYFYAYIFPFGMMIIVIVKMAAMIKGYPYGSILFLVDLILLLCLLICNALYLINRIWEK